MQNDEVWRPNFFSRRPGETTNGIEVGSLVKISQNASYWDGKKVERWYWLKKWYVTELDGNKATLGKDETGKYECKSPVSTNFLTVVKAVENE